jgi:hypothetical protein
VWDAALGSGPWGDGEKVKIPLSLSLEARADWTENKAEAPDWLGNYGEAWVKSWNYLAPNDGSPAAKRESRLLFKTGLETLPLGLDLSLEGSSAFTRSRNTSRPESAARLAFPVSIGPWKLRPGLEREFTRSFWDSPENLWDDWRQWGDSVQSSGELWYSLPLYALFDPRQGERLDRTLEASGAAGRNQQSRFKDAFSLALGLPSSCGPADFLVPRSVEARLSRTLEQRLDTRLDTLTLEAGLGFSAINLFGAFGTVPLFNFYRSDEFLRRFDAVWAFPHEGDRTWKIQETETMVFYGFTGAELDLSNTVTIDSRTNPRGGGSWTENLALAWTAPAPKIFIGALFDRFFDGVIPRSPWLSLAGLASAPREKLRKESLEFSIDHTRDYPRLSLSAGHEAIVRVPGSLSLSSFAKLSALHDSRTSNLSITAVLGLAVEVRF